MSYKQKKNKKSPGRVHLGTRDGLQTEDDTMKNINYHKNIPDSCPRREPDRERTKLRGEKKEEESGK